MTSKTFYLVNQTVIENCFAYICEQVTNDNHKVVVTVGNDSEKARTLAQNRLYWSWLSQIEQQTGQHRDDWHIYFKRRFLASIYAKDDGEFAQMIDSVKKLKTHLCTLEYENIATSVAKLLSTTTASSKQFTDYLNDIEVWAYANGLTLTIPQELEWVR